MSVRIRLATADEDWAAIHSLLTEAFAFMEGRIDPPSSLGKLDPAGLAGKAAQEIVLIAEAPELAGCLFARAEPDRLYLGKLAVRPARQGLGIGRALIAAAEREAIRLGLAELELQTRIELSENHAAFTALGFQRVGETAHPGFDRPTSVTMRKRVRAVEQAG